MTPCFIPPELVVATVLKLPFIHQVVLAFLKDNPSAQLKHVCSFLSDVKGKTVTQAVASRCLKKMGWSWKIPIKFQVAKYTIANLVLYIKYLRAIQQQDDWTRLKYADESHIVSKDLDNGRRLGMVNERIYRSGKSLSEKHASISLLTRFGDADDPIVIDYREETNTQWDFYSFVESCCTNSYLTNGDILIVDNASVHGGAASREVLEELLDIYGVQLAFLPAYSPELNPCEFVFSIVKRHIRENRDNLTSQHIYQETMEALATVTNQHLFAFYSHCIFPKHVLPDLNK